MHAGIQERDQRVHRVELDPRVALGQHVRAQGDQRAHVRCCERRTRAGGVAAHKVHLQLRELIVRNRHVGERAEAGVDAVDRLACGRVGFHDVARGADPIARHRRDRNRLAIEGDSRKRIQAE